VARPRLRPGAPPPRSGLTDLVALVHVELESRASTVAFRPRMFEYYIQLRRDTGLPVLPIALFLRVGLDGIGSNAWRLMLSWTRPKRSGCKRCYRPKRIKRLNPS
jgi:hypothetical protein